MLSSGRVPYQIHTDRDGEFINKHVQGFLKEKDIHFFTTNNETKASVVERFNRTLKSRMWKDFTHRNSLKYVGVLSKLVEGYNRSYHRSIKMRSIDVTKENEGTVWNTLYTSYVIKDNGNYKFKLGERVRIAKSKLKYEKGYLPNWSEELFTVVKRKPKPIPVYRLQDWNGEDIGGDFYEHELPSVKVDDNALFKIEKILKKRKRNGKVEYFVKWQGYPAKFNSWTTNMNKE
ncbi:Chromobox protein-like 7 [Holothuria leucospilota]|uniref:Chromobox protein-like 7 n=1 Tax=Holothuria leucospilota TaxID=206669 RepID=A0A9Q1BK42_HOLLE|nr:Chromobox protein-like 7 [Holothuria leucospilota]